MDTPSVVADNLSKRYGSREAVRGVSFRIDKGRCFGFLGPNGAGKTTTMRMVGCVSPRSGGSLRIFDLDSETHARAIKRRVGVVPQDDNLDQYLTVRENLTLYGHYFDLSGPQLYARVAQLLEFVHLQDRKDTEVRALSGGMRRRLLIARALVNNPELIILDEPTTGLDPQARHLLWERLHLLKDEQHRTLILSTHYMEEAEQLCDELVIMEDGRFVAQGAPADLIAQHVRPEVIEIIAPEAARHQAMAWGAEHQVDRELLQDRVLFFVRQAEAILPQILAHYSSHGKVLARRSSLEDVYLKLAGRALQEPT